MTGAAALQRFNAERHRDVRLVPGSDLSAFAQINHVRLGLAEVTPAAADYPLVFLKDADSGQFHLTALFGLNPGTNSFLDGDFWQAVYLPLEVQAAPFRLAGPDRALVIDEASALVSTDIGEPLFTSDGSETAVLLRIRALLDQLAPGRAAAAQLIAAVLPLGLIRPVALTVHLADGQTQLVQGLYSISPPRLHEIAPEALLDLHSRDLLGPIYAIMHSLTQVNRIRQLYNLRANNPISAFELVMEQH